MSNDLLADPLGAEPLAADGDLLRNDHGVWPVLGGVPILVADPAAYIAARRTALLGALAEAGRCEPETVAMVRLFADAARGVTPELDADDFLADEEGPLSALHPLAEALFAERARLPELLAQKVGRGRVLEVGCGAGTLTRRLDAPVVCDRSLRALLVATAGTDATPVVADASALPFARGAFRCIVAANVVDLLDDVGAFVDEARRVLGRGGRLVLSTPDPALGSDDDLALDALLEGAGFAIDEAIDAVPWIRAHGPRHAQLYLTRVLVARRA